MDIGKHHPQALVYPLTVASKSASLPRRNAANKILKNMCEHSASLVQQAVMVGYSCGFCYTNLMLQKIDLLGWLQGE